MGGKRNRHGHGHGGSRGGGGGKSRQPRLDTAGQPSEGAPSTASARLDGLESEEEMDFCQRFFGDPLFSNLNVSLLFLTATFLPMVVWIPHFLSEYRRLRHIQFLEEERQMRMQKARVDLKSTQPQDDGGASVSDNDITILQDSITPSFNSKSSINFPEPGVLSGGGRGRTGASDGSASNKAAQATILPTLCPDGRTVGYDNWFLLRDAVTEANAIAAEEFLRWNEYLVRSATNKSVEPPVYHPPEPFVICPGVTLNQKSPYRSILSPYYWASYLVSFLPYGSSSSSRLVRSRSAPKAKNKLSSIFINAEDIEIECDMCVVDLPGTHFSFGPHAKNVLIRGITFRGATTSSLTFHHHGADVSLEDCYWLWNSGGVVNNNRNGPYANVNGNDGLTNGGAGSGSTTTAGAVCDLNSTSTVTFYRCVIDDVKQNPKRTTTGAGVANVPGMNPPAGHHMGALGNLNQNNGGSLTIRN
ncbi:hypothetical protein ACHAXT_004914 [Thalassiosira profunda]